MNSASPLITDSLPNRFLKRFFSFPVAIASLLAVLAVLTVRSRFDDPDMWWHLRIGQIIWTTHTIPVTDIFSFTTNHHSWIPHEWLAQTTIFAAYHWAGYSGLMFWLCLVTTAVFIAGYALCSLYSGNIKVSFLGALIIFVFATVGVSIRPQLIGYLFLILELLLIHLGRSRNARWFWLLPPLFAIWVNCHGSFFLGIILAAVFLFSGFFEFRIGSLSAKRWGAGTRKIFVLAMLLSIAALFANPIGLKLILYPADTLLHQPVGLSIVQEWQPLHLNSARGTLLLAVLGGIFLLGLMQKSQLYLEELLLLAIGVWLAGSHDRMLFVFGILAAPILSRMLSGSWENYDPATDRKLPNAILFAAVLAVVYLAFPKSASLTRQAEQTSPARAVDFIKSHHLSGPMLNDYTYGGYLIWALPEQPVFVDGRGDVYEWTGVLQEFERWATLQSDTNLLLDKYKIQFCLLTPNAPVTHVLTLIGWKPIYSDPNAVIFVRPGSFNSLIPISQNP